MDARTLSYADSLARLIRLETVSGPDTSGDEKFSAFRSLTVRAERVRPHLKARKLQGSPC